MASKKWAMRALLLKLETTYGADSVPTGAANAIKGVEIDFNPSVGGEIPLDYIVPWLGHQGVMLDGTYGTVSFSVDITGAGAAGTAPAYGPALRACGLRQVINTGVDVQYNPISSLEESCSIRWIGDGIQHILLGARGTFTLSMQPGQIPRIRFTMSGLVGTISDVSNPALTLASFQPVQRVNKANTTFSLHGYDGGTEGITMDLGGRVEPDFLINSEAIEITDRRTTGNATMRAAALSTVNWLAISEAETRGELVAQHGQGAGKIFRLEADYTQIGRVGYSQTRGFMNNTLPLMMTTGSGNDEFLITVK
ncbi:phage tail tube protein [Ensifer soli]|uniref:phage tail tube protein n=1 Tax=Ciceribacter sp. sgz301302 TaxID=3342379 RepID=UPI0035B8668F